MRSIITVKDLSFSYGKTRILKDVNLEIKEKSFLVILGPNGGGKSTLLKLILGIIPLQKGSVSLFETTQSDALYQVGYVPQDTEQIKNFPVNVKDCVKMGFFRGSPKYKPAKKEIDQKVGKALERLGLSAYRNARLNELSNGQRQRALIARAIAHDPQLLVLDEPISVIDPTGQKIILELLKSLQEKTTIIFVSHDLSVIPAFSTAVACVNRTLYYHNKGELSTEVLEAAYGDLANMALVRHD